MGQRFTAASMPGSSQWATMARALTSAPPVPTLQRILLCLKKTERKKVGEAKGQGTEHGEETKVISRGLWGSPGWGSALSLSPGPPTHLLALRIWKARAEGLGCFSLRSRPPKHCPADC